MKNFLSPLLLTIGLTISQSFGAIVINPEAETSTAPQWSNTIFTPTWGTTIPATGDILRLGTSSITSSSGNFVHGEATGTLTNLTDGDISPVALPLGNGTPGIAAGIGEEITFTLAPTQLASIAVYGGWQTIDRASQAFTVSYSTDGINYLTLTTVNFQLDNSVSGHPTASRVLISDSTGAFASGALISNLRFTYGNGPVGYNGYTEIAAYAPAPIPEPSTALLLGAGALGMFLIRRRRK